MTMKLSLQPGESYQDYLDRVAPKSTPPPKATRTTPTHPRPDHLKRDLDRMGAPPRRSANHNSSMFAGAGNALHSLQRWIGGGDELDALVKGGSDHEIRKNIPRLQARQRQRGRNMVLTGLGGVVAAISTGLVHLGNVAGAFAQSAMSQSMGGAAVAVDPTGTLLVGGAVVGAFAALWLRHAIPAVRTQSRIDRARLDHYS